MQYYHYDGLGSTRYLSDESGTITDSYDYEAFGQILNETGISENDYRFAGEQLDENLDQYYLRARYYNQNSGRFTQLDTYMGDNNNPITLHKYLYANADPVNGIDPSGRVTLIGLSTAGRSQASLILRSSGSAIKNIAGRNTTTRILFGKPPEDFGIVGDFIIDHALSVIDPFLGTSIDTFKNSGAFGTNAHYNLESSINGYEPFPGVKIDAEVFFHEPDNGKTHLAKKKREKGSIGIDIVVNYQDEPIIAFDLKTGKGFSKSKVNKLKRRAGLDIVEIKVEFFDK